MVYARHSHKSTLSPHTPASQLHVGSEVSRRHPSPIAARMRRHSTHARRLSGGSHSLRTARSLSGTCKLLLCSALRKEAFALLLQLPLRVLPRIELDVSCHRLQSALIAPFILKSPLRCVESVRRNLFRASASASRNKSPPNPTSAARRPAPPHPRRGGPSSWASSSSAWPRPQVSPASPAVSLRSVRISEPSLSSQRVTADAPSISASICLFTFRVRPIDS